MTADIDVRAKRRFDELVKNSTETDLDKITRDFRRRAANSKNSVL